MFIMIASKDCKKRAQQRQKVNELLVSNGRYLHDQTPCKPSKKAIFW